MLNFLLCKSTKSTWWCVRVCMCTHQAHTLFFVFRYVLPMCHGLIQGEPSGKITAGNLGPYWKERKKRSFLMSTLKHLPKRKGSTLGSFWMKLLRWESLSFISGIFIYSLIVQYTDIVFGVLVRPIFEFLGFLTFSSDFPPLKHTTYHMFSPVRNEWVLFAASKCIAAALVTEMPLAVHYQWALLLSLCRVVP